MLLFNGRPNEVQCLNGVEIVALSCGEDHVLAQVTIVVSRYIEPSACKDEQLYTYLTFKPAPTQEKSGSLLSWGRGECGQLGHGQFCHSATPRSIEALNGLRISKCGVHFELRIFSFRIAFRFTPTDARPPFLAHSP